MGALKVTEFDAAATLTGDEIFGFVQDAGNVQDTLDSIVTFIQAAVGDVIQEWAPNWNVDLDLYIPAVEAMTISQGNAKIGIGTLTYEKSTTATPGTFNSTTLPVTLQAGAWLKVSATGVDTFLATHLIRTA